MVTKSLYKELQSQSQDDVKARLKLDALHTVLHHHKIVEPKQVVTFGEALLRMEGLTEVIPGDEKIAKLMGVYRHFKGVADT